MQVFKDEATVTLSVMTETTEFYGKRASEIAGYTVYYEHGELPSASSQKYKHPLTFRWHASNCLFKRVWPHRYLNRHSYSTSIP